MTQGIYKIQNRLNNKLYIGFSKDIDARVKLHMGKLRNNSHHNKFFQQEFTAFGECNFFSDIVEVVPNKIDANDIEWYWIMHYQSNNPNYGYNSANYSKPNQTYPGYEQITLPSDVIAAIQQIASELGYIQKRGVGTGKVGSMAQLMQAIATGEVKVTQAQPGGPEPGNERIG